MQKSGLTVVCVSGSLVCLRKHLFIKNVSMSFWSLPIFGEILTGKSAFTTDQRKSQIRFFLLLLLAYGIMQRYICDHHR